MTLSITISKVELMHRKMVSQARRHLPMFFSESQCYAGLNTEPDRLRSSANTSARWRPMRPKFLLLAFLILPSLAAHGQHHFRVLHAFGSGTDGAGVWDSVALDSHGNLYGTTSGGGEYGYGTVFELNPQSTGRWKESLLESFKVHDPRGAEPNGGLVLGHSGSLIGTTQTGGKYGFGTTFELTPQRGFRVIHNFGGQGDYACCPWGNLVVDAHGNLYGTSYAAFELSPGSKGWAETQLHLFTGDNGDGSGPQAGPIRDAGGNLYGTTLYGGGSKICSDGCGTVWELSPPTQGSGTQGWTEHILHSFGVGDELSFPGVGQLAMDSRGNLYGAVLGGKYRAGVIYKLSPAASSSAIGEGWQENVVYNFTGGDDGDFPEGVIIDSAGNLYGITGNGGKYGEGVVFKLSPQADGRWKYTLLHTFTGSDGAEPVANLTFGPDGKLYGATATGGKSGGGVVFQLTP
jgi:uncharacterized repeat protein (TIGR03803 family)